MRDEFSEKLNELLVDTFNSIQKVEETALTSMGKQNLTISEFHTLESIARMNEDPTIGEIAQANGVTLPTVTVALNKLERKGYVEKTRSATDGRVVHITLTRLGKKMDAVHQYFHERMIRNVSRDFGKDEMQILIRCIEKLNLFFKNQQKVKGSEGQ